MDRKKCIITRFGTCVLHDEDKLPLLDAIPIFNDHDKE